jgi:16S rRNA G966 N2-methylase RsmD
MEISNTSIQNLFPPKNKQLSFVDRSQLKISADSWYSITPWKEANYITVLLLNQLSQLVKGELKYPTITDVGSNVGGNTISFWNKGFSHVNSIEIDDLTAQNLRANLKVYDLPDKYVHCADWNQIWKQLDQDVVFIDPPWGGPSYKEEVKLIIYLGSVALTTIVNQLFEHQKIKLVALKLPFNTDQRHFEQATKHLTKLWYRINRGQTKYVYHLVLIWSKSDDEGLRVESNRRGSQKNE